MRQVLTGRASLGTGAEAPAARLAGVDLYVDIAGEGAPVVFVHAGICDSRMWDPQWAPFTAAYRAVRLDLRGFGRSPLPPEPYSHGRDLVALLERLGTGPVALVAASSGGGVALQVAVARPDLVAALVLADASLPGHAWSEDVKASWAEEEAALERGDLDAAVEVNLRMWVDGPRRPPRAVDPTVRERVGEMQRWAFELQVPVWDQADEEALAPDVAARLGEIRVPALVVVGEEDVTDLHEIAERLARELPDGRHATIAAAAHLPSLERPGVFNELALGFLDQRLRR
jgi:3-oxoadipate enol-lactonase